MDLPNELKLENIQKDLAGLPDGESKLKRLLEILEEMLADKQGAPHFKSFWEIRKQCLELFKDNTLNPVVRSICWKKYTEIAEEASRLKDILDQESAFAVEQIDRAIQGLEKDLEHLKETVEHASPIRFDVLPHFFRDKLERYVGWQTELHLLNAYASHVTALRKELMKTEMRVRFKNKFFERLSKAGNSIFPRRKELIKQVSEAFVEDVQAFIKKHFSSGRLKDPLHVLREEIKTIQTFAKELTINAQAFSSTRMDLSQCWDQIKQMEKEKKKEWAEQKQQSKEQLDRFLERLQALTTQFEEKTLSWSEASSQLDEISNDVKRQIPGKDAQIAFREASSKLREHIQEKRKEEEEARQQHLREQKRQQQEKVAAYKQALESLLVATLTPAELSEEKKRGEQELKSLTCSAAEKRELEALLQQLGDKISDLKLQSLPQDARLALEEIKALIEEETKRRATIHEHLEQLRKAAASSGQDFARAIELKEQMEQEKERLAHADHTIEQLKAKIR